MIKCPKRIPPHLAEIWGQVAPEFHEKIGESGLEAVCGQLHQLRDAQARIADEGAIVVDDKGRAIEHPALAVERQAQAAIRTWREKFGSRSRSS